MDNFGNIEQVMKFRLPMVELIQIINRFIIIKPQIYYHQVMTINLLNKNKP